MNHLSHDALWSYARKELTTPERAVVRVHLDACAECRATLDEVKVATDVLAALPDIPPMPEALARRVGESLHSSLDPAAAKAFKNWWANLFTPRFVLASALGVLAVVGAAYLLSREAPQPAPIAEALLATALGLFAAIPSVVFYNIFQTRITAYGTRAEGFVAELVNAISRQLDRGA